MASDFNPEGQYCLFESPTSQGWLYGAPLEVWRAAHPDAWAMFPLRIQNLLINHSAEASEPLKGSF